MTTATQSAIDEFVEAHGGYARMVRVPLTNWQILPTGATVSDQGELVPPPENEKDLKLYRAIYQHERERFLDALNRREFSGIRERLTQLNGGPLS